MWDEMMKQLGAAETGKIPQTRTFSNFFVNLGPSNPQWRSESCWIEKEMAKTWCIRRRRPWRTRVIHRFSARCSKTRTCLSQCEGSGNTIRLRFQAGLIHHSCAGYCSSTPASGVSSCPPLGGAVSIHPAICSQVAKSMLSTSKIVIMEISIEPSLVRP